MRKSATIKVAPARKQAELIYSPRKLSPLEWLEREREFLSQELHDTVSQSLSGLTILISFLQSRLEKGHAVSAQQVAELKIEIHKAAEELKVFGFILKPQKLEGGELILALSELVDFTTQFRPCEFECKKPVFVTSQDKAFGLFRIAQEALRCAALKQTKKTLKVKLSEVESEVTLEIFPFPLEKGGSKQTTQLMELYCQSIGAKAEFKTKSQTLSCQVANL